MWRRYSYKIYRQRRKATQYFLDSGYERTYSNILKNDINKFINAGEKIDLWVVSHIHDDHSRGTMKYIQDVENGKIKDVTKAWFYNPPRHYRKYSASSKRATLPMKSINQGDRLYAFLERNRKLPKNDITSSSRSRRLRGIKIDILSPTIPTIEELRKKYKNKIPAKISNFDTLTAKAKLEDDYNKKIESFSINKFQENNSLENKSSISLLLEYNNKRILWLADSHPSIVIKTLSKKGFSSERPLVCDYVILSHHASKGNNSPILFDMIRCNNFIISCNGDNLHRLPNKEVLAKVIRNKKRDFSQTCSLFFTYGASNLS